MTPRPETASGSGAPAASAGLPLCDIHAHLADERLAPEREELLCRCRREGVVGVLVSAARAAEWPVVLELARRPGIHAALGIHPFFFGDWDATAAANLEIALESRPELRAVGEIGLDFFHGRAHAGRQLEIFAAQLECAIRHGRPVIVHNRKSWNEFFGVLREFDAPGLRGVCHHFTGSREVAREALDRGFYLSFCGPVTYENARRIKEAARYAPLERILAETDTPDLPPRPCRSRQSRPWQVRWVLEELARLKNLPLRVLARAVYRNFSRVLGLS